MSSSQKNTARRFSVPLTGNIAAATIMRTDTTEETMMKKRTIRTVSLALVCAFAAVSGACAKKDPLKPPGTTSGTADTSDPYEALPDADYNGYDFRVLIRDDDWIVADMFQDEPSSDTVQSQIYDRNRKVEGRYGISVVSVPKNDGFTAVDSIFAGDADYDLILPHARYCAVYAGGGYLLDWNTVPNLNTGGKWWDQNAIKSLSINGKLMYATGDISYWSYGATNLLLFNKDLFTGLELEFPYQKVRDNSWTIDDFEVLVKKGSKDLNGDGQIDKDNDRFGYMTIGFVGDVQAYHATGNTVISKDGDDTPYISYYTERAEDVWRWYSKLIYSEYCYFQDKLVSYFDTDAVAGFRDGRSLFIDINTINVTTMRNMENEFGIIPWPTYIEGEKFLTNVDAGLHLFCIPATAEDPGRTGLILEALCILGNRYVIPQYYETTVKYRDARDDESFEMLDLIFDGRVYDLGYYNVELTGAVGKNENIANNFKYLTENKVSSMAVTWSKFGDMANQYLSDYLDRLAEMQG